MGERLDAAATLSARTARAVAKTPFARQFRENALFVRRVIGAATTAAVTEAVSTEPRRRPVIDAPPHPGLVPQPVDDFVSGDDERCSCRGTGDDWCGATRGDVVHDLMSHGMRLERPQAEAIWRDAQAARAAETLR